MESKKILTIVGMGPGNGMGIARRFGKEGFTIAMISRNEEKLKKLQGELNNEGINGRRPSWSDLSVLLCRILSIR